MTEVVFVDDERTVVVIENRGTVITTDDPNTVIVEFGHTEVEVLSPSTSVDLNYPAGPPGPVGPPGAGGKMFVEAGENIPAFSVVAVGPDELAYLPDNNELLDASRVVGVASFAALTGEDLEITTEGPLVTSASWTLGPLFLGSGGTLTSVPTGAYQLQIAVALTASTLLVRPQFPIFT